MLSQGWRNKLADLVLALLLKELEAEITVDTVERSLDDNDPALETPEEQHIIFKR